MLFFLFPFGSNYSFYRWANSSRRSCLACSESHRVYTLSHRTFRDSIYLQECGLTGEGRDIISLNAHPEDLGRVLWSIIVFLFLQVHFSSYPGGMMVWWCADPDRGEPCVSYLQVDGSLSLDQLEEKTLNVKRFNVDLESEIEIL